MSEHSNVYKLENYGRKSPFASFLPGISGVKGIPIWSFYVNRGQGIVSFGVENKDHAIMEFYPAHQAYQNVKITGFRTFIKKEGKVLEAFQNEEIAHSMSISMNGLELEEDNKECGIRTNVTYFTLPGEKIGALVRKVCITNTDNKTVHLEILDGMPACIPYGVSQEDMKMMGQTIKAWMQVEQEGEIPFMRVRASIVDSAAVSEVNGGNFSIGSLSDGTRLRAITDPEIIFSYDLSLVKPVGFMEYGIEELENLPQVTENIVPCSFYGTKADLQAGESITLYQLIGQVESRELLRKFAEKTFDTAYYDRKKTEAENLVEELCSHIRTKTADKNFDAYCEYTYMDNVLRGGYPMQLSEDKVFYVYSRKHGDLERDYNFFSMLPEFYSQGNGNFRDVNQNRRCDTFFAPFVGDENIKAFYSLIQPDGYNPLGVEKVTYQLREEKTEEIFRDASDEVRRHLRQALSKSFTPGALYRELDSVWDTEEQKDTLFAQVMREAEGVVNGKFLEGYWSDHWTYNLDLLENYLSVFPEKEEELLYKKKYSYYMPQAKVRKRAERCVQTKKGIRQYCAIDHTDVEDGRLMRSDCGKGEVIYVTLMEKLLLLSVTKFTTLDTYGMGVEMEGGKPGWYDALNGLPGLFGSSMAESCELARNLEYTIQALKRYPGDVELSKELAGFIQQTERIVTEERQALLNEQKVLDFWNKANVAKERYREQIYQGMTGKTVSLSTAYLVDTLEEWHTVVRKGIQKACDMNEGICPTYFTFTVTKYDVYDNGKMTCVLPLDFEVQAVPLFLEGPVRYLKLDNTAGMKKTLYEQVKKSDLYDNKLSMYKVNASLEDVSYELGRARAFTPGWLENESIWLHMEYKYLLELLKSGMYDEFFEDFHKAAIPFLDEDIYGRSIYENSSFIASSKNPNRKYHGKGFVARLSGSTVEFLNMWTILMFGRNPFMVNGGELVLKFEPALPAYLVEADKT
ncbi:MAG: hypothetical protein K2M91_05410, partial [Lachnospiraceae bacterium]|nr:hypothetical protein [Lachnospiraceae bacterium]